MRLASAVRARLAAALAGRSGRSSAWSLLGQIAALVSSTANFVVLARLLGPSNYGLIAGALGLVYTIGPFAALGADKLVFRDIAGGRTSTAGAVTAALATQSAGALAATVLMVALHGLLLPQVPLTLLVALAVGELIASSAVNVCAGTFLATGAARAAGVTMCLNSAAKFAAVVVFALLGSTDPSVWAAFFCGSAMLTAVGSVAYVYSKVGRPVMENYSFLSRAKEGLPFSVNITAAVAQNDFDKVLLVRAGLTDQAGLYTVAYRLVNIAMAPVNAVLIGVYVRLFELGAEGGIVATSRFARRLLLPLMGYAVVAGLLLAVTSPLVPVMLGPEYDGTVPLLIALAPLVLLKVLQNVPSEALTGAGHQPARTVCAGLSASLNAGLCVLLIPRFGVQGALVATYVAESVGAVLIFYAVRRARQKSLVSHSR